MIQAIIHLCDCTLSPEGLLKAKKKNMSKEKRDCFVVWLEVSHFGHCEW